MSIGALATNYWRARKNPFQRKAESWTCPSEGELKINVDVSYSADKGCGSVGVVICDYRGKFIAAQTKELPFVADVMTAEAYAL
jgi:hypothetical protein